MTGLHVTLGKFDLSVPQFFHLSNGDKASPCLRQLLGVAVNDNMYHICTALSAVPGRR